VNSIKRPCGVCMGCQVNEHGQTQPLRTANTTVRIQEATSQVSCHCQNYVNCQQLCHPSFFQLLSKPHFGIFVLRWIYILSTVVHMKSNVLITQGINLHPKRHYFYLVFLFNQVTKSINFSLQIFQNGTAELGESITYWHNSTKNRDLCRALQK